MCQPFGEKLPWERKLRQGMNRSGDLMDDGKDSPAAHGVEEIGIGG